MLARLACGPGRDGRADRPDREGDRAPRPDRDHRDGARRRADDPDVPQQERRREGRGARSPNSRRTATTTSCSTSTASPSCRSIPSSSGPRPAVRRPSHHERLRRRRLRRGTHQPVPDRRFFVTAGLTVAGLAGGLIWVLSSRSCARRAEGDQPAAPRATSGSFAARRSHPDGDDLFGPAAARHQVQRDHLGDRDLVLNEAAYMAEIIRGGFLAVPSGQNDAARRSACRARWRCARSCCRRPPASSCRRWQFGERAAEGHLDRLGHLDGGADAAQRDDHAGEVRRARVLPRPPSTISCSPPCGIACSAGWNAASIRPAGPGVGRGWPRRSSRRRCRARAS